MTSGPTLIKKCSSCTNTILQQTLASGNTFGAVYWTDGKCEAPLLPLEPRLAVCPFCHKPFWVDDLEVLGEIEPEESCEDQFRGAKELIHPTIEDYIRALGAGIVPPKEELYVRRMAWWKGNDGRRGTVHPSPLSTLEISNLTVFAKILDETNRNELVTKAEILRELGRFAEAIELLDHAASTKLTAAVARILELSNEKDSFVRILFP